MLCHLRPLHSQICICISHTGEHDYDRTCIADATTIGTPVSQNSYLSVNYLLFGSISAEDSILLARSAVKGQSSIRM
jgi:hypothetical protein